MVEIKISVKNSQKRITQEFNYWTILLDKEDPELLRLCEKVVAEFKGEDKDLPVEDVVVKAKLVLD